MTCGAVNHKLCAYNSLSGFEHSIDTLPIGVKCVAYPCTVHEYSIDTLPIDRLHNKMARRKGARVTMAIRK